MPSRAVYNRHDYADEKAAALERLAALIARILNPGADNLVAIGKRQPTHA